jgi:hypothetical protein
MGNNNAVAEQQGLPLGNVAGAEVNLVDVQAEEMEHNGPNLPPPIEVSSNVVNSPIPESEGSGSIFLGNNYQGHHMGVFEEVNQVLLPAPPLGEGLQNIFMAYANEDLSAEEEVHSE